MVDTVDFRGQVSVDVPGVRSKYQTNPPRDGVIRCNTVLSLVVRMADSVCTGYLTTVYAKPGRGRQKIWVLLPIRFAMASKLGIAR